MCGITGWISYDRDLRNETVTVDAMTETMACRGPTPAAPGSRAPRPSATAGSRSSICPADVSP